MLRALTVLIMVLASSACVEASRDEPRSPHRILFVGNSLLYYNDLPSLFIAWGESQPDDQGYTTEMLAEAGYSLSQHLEAGVLENELETGAYDFVILQEIGGWPLCPRDDVECADTEGRLRLISEIARRNGAEPIWMATWHPSPDAQRRLSEQVAAIAERVGIRVVDTGRALHSSAEFDALEELLAPDMHPDLQGSWYLAALIVVAVRDSEIVMPAVAVEACRRDWRSIGIVADRVASEQPQEEKECGPLSADIQGRIVSDVNAALGFRR